MYQEERMQAILDYLKQNKRISADEICRLYDVSRDTARRDLVSLADRGAVIRTHGGAILPASHDSCKPYSERIVTDVKEKQHIAACAARLIKQGDCVIFDASTTVLACAELLDDVPFTLITNAINVADVIATKENITLIMLGGRLRHRHRYFYGATTLNTLSECFADKLFIGAAGFSEHGLTVDHDEDAAVIRKMISQAKQAVVLADSSKFGKTCSFKICDLSQIDLVITASNPPDDFADLLAKHNVDLIVAKKLSDD
ncbi:HTH-type transcriptional repressor GlcR [Sporomusa rhizae]|uniref:DeoR/GlpR family DNA-binding transcription regulator n=1 Tax=Sporomusa rhizae TaxID=357999 RepID=UPI00352A6883